MADFGPQWWAMMEPGGASRSLAGEEARDAGEQ